MGGKNDSPNYGDLAVQQGEANAGVVRDQTYANRPTQYSPFGYTSWEANPYTDPGSGEQTTQWSQSTGLTPELQNILNKQISIQDGRTDIAGMLTQRMGNDFGNKMDWRGLNPMGQVPTSQFTLPENTLRNLNYNDAPGVDIASYSGAPAINEASYSGAPDIGDASYGGAPSVGDPTRLRQRAEDSVYGKAQSRLAPRFEGQRESMEIKLRNQGLGPEDAAYQAQMQGIDQQETDAYGQAQYDAVNQGLGEQQQLFGQDMGLRNMSTGETDRTRQNEMGLRNLATGEIDRTRQNETGLRNLATGEVDRMLGNQMGLRNMATGEADRQSGFYNQAGNQAYNQAYGANQANFGQAMQGSAYANQIRQQQITEAMAKRGMNLNEINALLSGQQVGMPSMPNFTGATAAQAAPIYQGGVDQGNFDQGQNMMGDALGLAGTLGGGFLAGRNN